MSDEADADDEESAESGGAPDVLLDADMGGVSPALWTCCAATIVEEKLV